MSESNVIGRSILARLNCVMTDKHHTASFYTPSFSLLSRNALGIAGTMPLPGTLYSDIKKKNIIDQISGLNDSSREL